MRRWWWVALAAAGCEPVPAMSMADLAFPEDFRLETARVVHLELSGDVGDGWLGLSTADGAALYEGPAAYVVAHGLDLRVPAGVDALRLTVRDGGDARVEVVAVTPELRVTW